MLLKKSKNQRRKNKKNKRLSSRKYRHLLSLNNNNKMITMTIQTQRLMRSQTTLRKKYTTNLSEMIWMMKLKKMKTIQQLIDRLSLGLRLKKRRSEVPLNSLIKQMISKWMGLVDSIPFKKSQLTSVWITQSIWKVVRVPLKPKKAKD